MDGFSGRHFKYQDMSSRAKQPCSPPKLQRLVKSWFMKTQAPPKAPPSPPPQIDSSVVENWQDGHFGSHGGGSVHEAKAGVGAIELADQGEELQGSQ